MSKMQELTRESSCSSEPDKMTCRSKERGTYISNGGNWISVVKMYILGIGVIYTTDIETWKTCKAMKTNKWPYNPYNSFKTTHLTWYRSHGYQYSHHGYSIIAANSACRVLICSKRVSSQSYTWRERCTSTNTGCQKKKVTRLFWGNMQNSECAS